MKIFSILEKDKKVTHTLSYVTIPLVERERERERDSFKEGDLILII